ncbi:calcium/sodium antiporter [bacterium]|nr:calcium/sodium antiporter [bacterium]MBU1065297.1 calcium/sodium antiporter [bacterium]MBU1635612.1 calcium/sodium antiporter [bacterium]MBU1875469.1 calcium/sodium antiporter [bacterium]
MAGLILFLFLGLVLLFLGAEGLVKGASSLSLRLGINPLTIGLTVVAFGTSMPELFTSIKAVLNQFGAISVGNVIGSNIFNIAVIVGIAALIYPMNIQTKLIRRDVPIMIIAGLLFVPIFLDLTISRVEGLFLTAGILGYTIYNFHVSKKDQLEADELITCESIPNPNKNILIDFALIIVGLGLLTFGSSLLINNSIQLARILGINEAVIGLTIIAAGTSLPELATSVVAAYKKEPEIAIGNIVGSNIFNIFCVLGISSLVAPIHGNGISWVDVFLMLGLSIVLLPLMMTDRKISRKEGLFLLLVYGCYLSYLLIKSFATNQ